MGNFYSPSWQLTLPLLVTIWMQQVIFRASPPPPMQNLAIRHIGQFLKVDSKSSGLELITHVWKILHTFKISFGYTDCISSYEFYNLNVFPIGSHSTHGYLSFLMHCIGNVSIKLSAVNSPKRQGNQKVLQQ